MMGVMYEAVDDRIGERGVGHRGMPVIDGQLAGHDCRATLVPLIDEIQKIRLLRGRQAHQSPVVEHEDVDVGELALELQVAAVTMPELELP